MCLAPLPHRPAPDHGCGYAVSVPDSASTTSGGATGATSASGAASCAGEGVPLIAIDEDRIAGDGRRAARAGAPSTTVTSGAGRATSASSAGRTGRASRTASAGTAGEPTEQR